MQYNIQITEEAHQDVKDAVDYYTEKNSKIADRFEHELYTIYNKVASNPQFYKYLTKGKKKKYRCVKLLSFPFLVIYRIKEQTAIIIAVFNTHKKPIYGLP